MTCCSIAFFPAFCCKSLRAVCCTPGTAALGGMNLDIPWIALSTDLCGSEPIGNSGRAAWRIFRASLTFDIAPAWAPGEAVGTAIGEEPIGGWPESEGGRGMLRAAFTYRRCLRRRLRVNCIGLLLLRGRDFKRINPLVTCVCPWSTTQDAPVASWPVLLVGLSHAG